MKGKILVYKNTYYDEKIKKDFPVEILNKIRLLFNILNWPIKEDDLFNRFCEMVSVLSDEQQDLIIQITKGFLKFDSSNQYVTALLTVFPQFMRNLNSKIKQIFIAKLKPENDLDRTKSPEYVFYQLKKISYRFETEFSHINFYYIDKPPIGLLPPDEIKKRQDVLIVLIDDFIGTGDTAIEAIKFFSRDLGYSKEIINIISLVALREGFNRINKYGVKILTYLILEKGISDNYPKPLRDEYLSIMKDIEDMLNVSSVFRFGYKQSEALVKMVGTPDNTFPVYWFETDIAYGTKFIAPFPI